MKKKMTKNEILNKVEDLQTKIRECLEELKTKYKNLNMFEEQTLKEVMTPITITISSTTIKELRDLHRIYKDYEKMLRKDIKMYEEANKK